LNLPDVRIGLERLRGQGVEVVAEPQVIFSHENGRLGPAGTDEWMAFIKDSEGNTLGLVSQLPPG
jgi:methylmalonyl-CoA/ethylmalonyl-CoA epimerase